MAPVAKPGSIDDLMECLENQALRSWPQLGFLAWDSNPWWLRTEIHGTGLCYGKMDLSANAVCHLQRCSKLAAVEVAVVLLRRGCKGRLASMEIFDA